MESAMREQFNLNVVDEEILEFLSVHGHLQFQDSIHEPNMPSANVIKISQICGYFCRQFFVLLRHGSIENGTDRLVSLRVLMNRPFLGGSEFGCTLQLTAILFDFSLGHANCSKNLTSPLKNN